MANRPPTRFGAGLRRTDALRPSRCPCGAVQLLPSVQVGAAFCRSCGSPYRIGALEADPALTPASEANDPSAADPVKR